jgi:heterodisulfide reductase subunit C
MTAPYLFDFSEAEVYHKLQRGCVMETIEKAKKTFIDDICSIPGGEKIRLCIQCGTCSASCPNVNKMEYSPRQIIAMARAGMKDEVLSSNSMWCCASCYLCTVRCPRDIKPTELMHALECVAVSQPSNKAKTKTPAMYKSFSDFAYSLGSVPEVGFMTWYYLRTNPLRAMKMAPLALSLLRHGRMNIKAKRMKPEAERQLKAILNKAEELGGIE